MFCVSDRHTASLTMLEPLGSEPSIPFGYHKSGENSYRSSPAWEFVPQEDHRSTTRRKKRAWPRPTPKPGKTPSAPPQLPLMQKQGGLQGRQSATQRTFVESRRPACGKRGGRFKLSRAFPLSSFSRANGVGERSLGRSDVQENPLPMKAPNLSNLGDISNYRVA